MTARHPRAAGAPSDLAAVRRVMASHVGPEQAAPIGEIARACGLPERRVRAVLSDADGVLFLQGECAAGHYLARTADEAGAMTARLRSRALDELVRLRRRRAYAQTLRLPEPVAQLPLFWSAA